MSPPGPGWRADLATLEVTRTWPVAALLCPLVFAAIAPVSIRSMPAEQFVVLAQLPVYMAHQVEEHAGDRFRRFVNARAGAEVLSPRAVAVINLPGVWGVILVGFLAGALVHPGLGLVAAWLSVVNALAHLGAAIVLRGYNPGLVSAVVLLLPAGLLGLAVVGAAPGVGLAYHALGLGVAIAIHAAIILHVRARSHG